MPKDQQSQPDKKEKNEKQKTQTKPLPSEQEESTHIGSGNAFEATEGIPEQKDDEQERNDAVY